VCGDYCRSSADLTTMESAVESGLRTANHVLESLGASQRVPYTELDDGVPWWVRALRLLALPFIALLSSSDPRRGHARPEAAAFGASAVRLAARRPGERVG
jgi:hypothetical protein